MRIESIPFGARVYLNGSAQQSGTTPCALNLPPAGTTVTVRLALDGYEDFISTIRTGSAGWLRATLLPRMGGLCVKSKPIGATVLLNNEPRGVTTPNGLTIDKLPFGTYTLTVRLDNYQDYTTQVQINGRTTQLCKITLQPIPLPPTQQPAPPPAAPSSGSDRHSSGQWSAAGVLLDA